MYVITGRQAKAFGIYEHGGFTMKIRYNVTGPERKALVAAISQELNAPTNYLGAPTFAYEVGGYHIDKNGTVTGEDNMDLEDALYQKGFSVEKRECDEPDAYESRMGATPSVEDVRDEAEAYVEREMRRLKLESENVPDYSNRGQYGGDDIPAFEELQMTEGEELGLGKERREDFRGENGMRADDCPETFTYQAELSDPDCPDRMEVFTAENDVEALKWAKEQCTGEIVLLELRQLDENYDFVRGVDIAELVAANGLYDAFAVEIPKNGLTDAQVQNILKLVESKRTLLTKALGRPLTVNDKGETLQFIYPYSEEAGVGIIYSQLSTAFVNHAKKHQRVTAAEREVESEKFAMRTFLVRLGMNGGEFSMARKWLCRNLSGNASFPNDASYAAMQASRRNGGQLDEQE
jgi:hypothetical protein